MNRERYRRACAVIREAVTGTVELALREKHSIEAIADAQAIAHAADVDTALVETGLTLTALRAAALESLHRATVAGDAEGARAFAEVWIAVGGVPR